MNYRRNIDPMPKRRNHTISNGTFELIFGWTIDGQVAPSGVPCMLFKKTF
jgi:hypothetical protein